MRRASFPALALAAALLAGAARAGDAGVHWRGDFHALDALPEAMSEPARAAVEAWAPWAVKHEYRLDLDAEGRVLLGSPDKSGRLRRWLELETRTVELFEELLPAPERIAPKEPETAATEEAPELDVLPEDPESPPAGAPAPRTTVLPPGWGVETPALDTETVVLFVLRNEEAQAALLDALAERFDYLGPWAEGARKLTGFVLERPLLGAYLLDAAGQEEWDPDNELVNRLAQLLVLRRFGRQPYWSVQGFAWHVEERLRGAIYCFPYRDEFVWATEHGDWDGELSRRYKQKEAETVSVDELADWTRGAYRDEAARLSWGFMTFLVRRHGDELSGFLELLRAYRDEHDRVPIGGGRWRRDPTFRIPADELARLLRESFGEDVLEEAAAYFKAGLPKR